MKKILKIIIAQLLTLFVFLVIIAIAGQIYTFLKPGYKFLGFIPDRDIGWRFKSFRPDHLKQSVTV